jgi:hypothetical protein
MRCQVYDECMKMHTTDLAMLMASLPLCMCTLHTVWSPPLRTIYTLTPVHRAAAEAALQ